jgi:hypothetical protein
MDTKDNSFGVVDIFPTYCEAIHFARSYFLEYLMDLVSFDELSQEAITDSDTLQHLLQNLEIENAGDGSFYSLQVEHKKIKRENRNIEAFIKNSDITEFKQDGEAYLRQVFEKLQSEDQSSQEDLTKLIREKHEAAVADATAPVTPADSSTTLTVINQ